MSKGLFGAIEGPGEYQAVIEDDGRVAYTYLLAGKEIVADVWLYNRAPSPQFEPWATDGPWEMPCLNPSNFVSASAFHPPASVEDFHVEWIDQPDGLVARIFLRGDLHAELTPGSRPGWCKLAAKDGPCARKLS
jgi:hypothetical protein